MAWDVAVLFDMDGVILDSEWPSMEAWKIIGHQRGLANIEQVMEECTGVNEAYTAAAMKRHYGESFDYLDFRRAVLRERLRICGDVVPAKKGAREVLTWLRETGIPRALASSTRRELVEKELSDVGLLDFFDVLITGDMVAASKPAPDIFLTAARAVGREPRSCFVVEDSPNGIRAASAAGTHPILVPDRMAVTQEMRDQAEWICPSLIEVRNLLAGLMPAD